MKKNTKIKSQPNIWFNIKELRSYLPYEPTMLTIYCLIKNHQMPFHRYERNLRFLESEIKQWLTKGIKRSVSEIKAEADNYLIKKRKGQ